MSFLKKNDDPTLDAVELAAARIRDEELDPAVVEGAAARVWQRLTAEARNGAAATAERPEAATAAPQVVATIRGCDDFQSLIPAYLAGELQPARALLLEDHTRTCINCRRALKDARAGAARTAAASPARPVTTPFSARARSLWMGLAAALVFTLGLAGWVAYQDLFVTTANVARVESIDGHLFLVDGEEIAAADAGLALDEGQEVRTAKGSRAMVRLADGSLVELSERAGLSVETDREGTTINLERGNVIVQAAEQREKHLFVRTDDCLVSVTGTIFAVNRGTKGSRVSVVEGEVRVKQAKRDSILHPGGQVTTHASVAAVPIGREIAWSRDAGRYQELLAELTALGRDIDAQVARPGVRTSTALLDLAPAETTIWIALPNLARSMGETQRLLDQRLAENAVLQQWWQETMGSAETQERFHELVEEIDRFGSFLGEEVAVAINTDHGPVLLAEVQNPAGLSAYLAEQADRLAGRHGRQVLTIVADPATVVDTDDGILVWVGGGVLVASPKAELLRQAAGIVASGSSPFAATTFHGQVAQAYEDGAGWLFAADLEQLVDREAGAAGTDARTTAESLGILDLEHFIVEAREEEGKVQASAALTFGQARRGLAAWLAEPSPMGSLEFFSPDANLVAAFVVKDPVKILDEMLATIPELGQELAKLQAEHGLDVREDLARPLGGEVAFAIDGPVVPMPSTKLVIEVYDPARLQQTIERLVVKLNDELRKEGKPEVRLSSQTAGGRTYYALRSPQAGHQEVHYLFVDGYMVTAPSRVLLDQALQFRDSGTTLARSGKFRQLLPHDGEVNFSALVYHDLGPVLGPLAGAMERVEAGVAEGGGPQPGIAGLMASAAPTLVYAYGEEDRILFASSSQKSPLGVNLGTLTGFGSVLAMMDQAHQEAGAASDAPAQE